MRFVWMIQILLLSAPFMIAILHLIFSRLQRQTLPQKVAGAAIGAGGLILIFSFWIFTLCGLHLERLEITAVLIYSFLVYLNLGYFYFHCFNATETAIRIRILHEIHAAGSLTKEEIFSFYKALDFTKVRLGRLLAAGELEVKPGGFYVIRRPFIYYVALAIQKLGFLIRPNA